MSFSRIRIIQELQGLLQDMVPGTKVTITRCLSHEGDEVLINGQKASIDENLQIRPTDIVSLIITYFNFFSIGN